MIFASLQSVHHSVALQGIAEVQSLHPAVPTLSSRTRLPVRPVCGEEHVSLVPKSKFERVNANIFSIILLKAIEPPVENESSLVRAR